MFPHPDQRKNEKTFWINNIFYVPLNVGGIPKKFIATTEKINIFQLSLKQKNKNKIFFEEKEKMKFRYMYQNDFFTASKEISLVT